METNTVIWFQERGAFLYWPVRMLSDLGPSTTFNIALTLLFWCWSYQTMSRIWMVNFATMYLTTILKLTFHTPRPYWIEADVQGLARASGFGMPSGHSLVSISVWGEFGRQFQRRRMWVICCAAVLGVGFSRLYLGVHSLAQVLVGFTLGAVFLVTYPALERRLAPWFQKLALPRQLGILFVASLVLCGIAVGVRLSLSSFDVPSDWVSMALAKRPMDGTINPKSVHSAILSASTGFGFLAGYLVLCFGGWDREAQSNAHRLARAALGTLILGPYIYYTRRLLHGDFATQLPFLGALSLAYCYGMLTGCLISLALPYVFFRLKI